MKHVRPISRMSRLACELRKNQTPAEAALWRALRGKAFHGLKFRRQHPLGPFIVDFVCLSRQLVIEVDGAVHEEKGRRASDMDRDRWLRRNGFVVLRISNSDVLPFVEYALRKIERYI